MAELLPEGLFMAATATGVSPQRSAGADHGQFGVVELPWKRRYTASGLV
jgi:hypothetical protein